jgi:hypothetical protein
VAEAFYIPDGDGFVATELTRGPWDPDAQHAGPPAALIGRALERCDGRPGASQIARVTYEILRPVPIGALTVEARVVRPGRSVELLEASLSSAGGEVAVRALAWRIRTDDVELPSLPADDPPPGPDAGRPVPFFDTGHDVGYHTAMEVRFVRGSFLDPGPATVWMRPRVAIVAGEGPTPLQRVLVAADSGNGVSAVLDHARYVFINTDLTVHLHRLPAGDWVCLDAVTLPEPHGVGMADTALYDERGRLGRALQSLFVAARAA